MKKNSENGHNLFDAISQFFGRASLPQEEKEKVSPLAEMESAFNTALLQLNNKIEALQREQSTEKGRQGGIAADYAKEHERRMQEAHTLILADIRTAHRRLGTGIDAAALEVLAKFLEECAEKMAGAQGVQEVMPCCRRSILRRLHQEAAAGAWSELEERLRAAAEPWPQTAQRDAFEDEETFARRRQRKYQETRSDFIGYDIDRSRELIYGIERAWKADYPGQGTPLWQELVLEGVATALRARIFKSYYERMTKNREKIISRAAELVGQELGALQKVLAEKNLSSLEDAHRVVTTSTRVLDEVIPEIAWQVVQGEVDGS